MRAIVLFATGTEEIEALTAADYLRRAGVEVIIAGVGGNTPVGAHGIKIFADTSLFDLDKNIDFDLLVLPGGMPGTANIDNDKDAQSLIEKAYRQEKYIAAICAAPMIIGKKGYLKGKQAVCFPGFEQYLLGAYISDEASVIDGKMITGRNAFVANEFAINCITALFGEKKAQQFRDEVNAK